MKKDFYKTNTVFLLCIFFIAAPYFTYSQAENLDRGVVAIRDTSSPNKVFVSWRMLNSDPIDIAFNVYRDDTKINSTPIVYSNITDANFANSTYTVKPVVDGVEQDGQSSEAWSQPFLTIPLQVPAGGITPTGEDYTYSPNDCSVGDLDGDGEYEIVVKWDPSNAKDNAHNGYTGSVYLDAYKLDGTHLWRIDLGKNIRAGAHYTQFIVYDLDGDGKAEVACKTSDGTVDGTGVTIGDAEADHRNTSGRILAGPEFLTVFNGETGAAMATIDYIPGRGHVNDWGDDYGNRVDRFLAGMGYFDGERPSLLMARGYYTRSVLVAWDWRNDELTQRWVFDTDTEGNEAYAGQGNHNLTIGDIDGDGKDEIVYGSMTLDDDGTGLYSTGLGHGDALHMSDMDPDRPGLEVWACLESPSAYVDMGLTFRDALTGERLWGVPTTEDIGRAMAADVDPRHKGYELWGARGGLYNVKGEKISDNKPSMNFGIWWDGDLQRELLDGDKIDKWVYTNSSSTRLLTAGNYGAASNNSSKATPGLSADILGDWREEVIFRHSDNDKLLLFSTTNPTTHRMYTLMQNRQYRTAVAWQNVGYNQPPHPSFYLGEEMDMATVGGIPEEEDDDDDDEESPVTGFSGTPSVPQFKLYPNPSESIFFLDIKDDFSYVLHDSLGQVVEKGKGKDKVTIGHSLASGIYILKVNTLVESITAKIIKK